MHRALLLSTAMVAVGCGSSFDEPIRPEVAEAARSPERHATTEPEAVVPSPPATITAAADAFVEVAIGGSHACARRANGRVACWGSNYGGALGDGTHDDREAAVAVEGVDDAVQLALGAGYSCVRHQSGHVSCWGQNPNGVLGTGDDADRRHPARVVELDDAVDLVLSATWSRACARRRSGAWVCWGAGIPGEGGVPFPPTTNRPAPVPLDGIESLAMGGDHACGRRADGSVVCWGRLPTGEPGTIQEATWPPAPVEGVDGAEGVGAYQGVSMAWRPSGPIWAWGQAYTLGGRTERADAAGRDVVQAIVTQYQRCAIVAAGEGAREVLCWGTGDEAQHLTGVPFPTQLAAGWRRLCVIDRGGGLHCWRANGYGAYGEVQRVVASAGGEELADRFPDECEVSATMVASTRAEPVEPEALCDSAQIAFGSPECPPEGPWPGVVDYRMRLFLPRSNGRISQTEPLASVSYGTEESAHVDNYALRSRDPLEVYLVAIRSRQECSGEDADQVCGMSEVERTHQVLTAHPRGGLVRVQVRVPPLDRGAAPTVRWRGHRLELIACGARAIVSVASPE